MSCLGAAKTVWGSLLARVPHFELEWLVSYCLYMYCKAGAGTICLFPYLILSQYLGANSICIVIFLKYCDHQLLFFIFVFKMGKILFFCGAAHSAMIHSAPPCPALSLSLFRPQMRQESFNPQSLCLSPLLGDYSQGEALADGFISSCSNSN